MSSKIVIAHDFNCPWCWIGLSQVKRLEAEFDVEVDWRGYELFPEELEWPESAPSDPPPANKPRVPSRFELALAAEGLPKLTSKRPSRMRTTCAHLAVEFAREHGCKRALIERLYRAHWLDGADLSDVDVVVGLTAGLPLDEQELRTSIAEKRFLDRVVPFDDVAYSVGVYNVPTFFIGDQRYAEQPYRVLREAVAAWLGVPEPAPHAHVGLVLPDPASEARPFVFINMVTTLDGKILTGERDEPVMDLGSPTDHATMRFLEAQADAVLIGASSLRATPKLWYPSRLRRIVLTQRGELPWDSRFFTDAPEQAVVVSPEKPAALPDGVRWIAFTDWSSLLATLQRDFGVQRLLIEGGSEVNAQVLRDDLVDELFWTVAPKIKLGRDVPTMADGSPLARKEVTRWELIAQERHADELFLRYRRQR